MKKIWSWFLSVFLLQFLCGGNAAAEEFEINGAGPSTMLAKSFFENFSRLPAANGHSFVVPKESLKHSGGVNATDITLFGRTGRPLNAEEKARNKDDIFLANVPVAFVAGSKVGIKELTLDQLEKIYTKRITNWNQVGGPNADIQLIGREPTEAMYSLLKACFPYTADTKFAKVFNHDTDVIKFMKKAGEDKDSDYALAFGSKTNFYSLNVLTVQGFSCSNNIGLVYDLKNAGHPLVKAVKEYAQSEEWKKNVLEMGYELVK